MMLGKHFRVEYLPKSLKFVWEVTSSDIPLHPDQKITPAHILSAFQIPLNPHDKPFIVEERELTGHLVRSDPRFKKQELQVHHIPH
jgi:hypothetical protein